MGEPVSVLRRIGNWFGLTGTYEPKAGEVRPLWYNVSKSKYLAISIPIWVAGIALFFLLLQGEFTGLLPLLYPCSLLRSRCSLWSDRPSK